MSDPDRSIAEGQRYNGCGVTTTGEGESGDEGEQVNSPSPPRCEVLSSPEQAREVLETSKRAGQVALDVETEGPGAIGGALAGVSFCFEPGLAYHALLGPEEADGEVDRKSTRLNSSHANISYAVFC